MDLNNLIVDLATNFDPSYINFFKKAFNKKKVFVVNQTNFRTILSLDKESVHIPKKYKNLRIQYLNEYLLNNQYVNKGQFVYAFSSDPTDSLILNVFTINNVSKDQLAIISAIFNTPDIKSVMSYQINILDKNISWVNFSEILDGKEPNDSKYTITFTFNENMYTENVYNENTNSKAKPVFPKIVLL